MESILPEVAKLRRDLLGDLDLADRADGLWQIQGQPFAGKSAFLRELAGDLRGKGYIPILVQPPERAPDAGAAAVLDVASGLAEGDRIGAKELDGLRDSNTSWEDKLTTLSGWLESSPEKLFLLCDEPQRWYYQAGDDADHFRQQTQAVVDQLLSAPCRKVVTGAIEKRGGWRRKWHLQPRSEAYGWLRNRGAWGPHLADAASALAEQMLAGLDARSPLEIRLLVALATVWPAQKVARWWDQGRNRRELSHRLAEALDAEPGYRPVLEAWGRISLARRAANEQLLDHLDTPAPDSEPGALLRYCLLYPDGEGYRLHELLKADARDNDRWLEEGEDPATHRDLYRFYQKRFSQRPAGDAEALVEECEAFHHAMHSGDRELMHAARPYFAAQLDLLGRTLSRDHKEYRTAAEVFERAYVWEPDDAYAHHYRAYNLDVLAESPEVVERHYKRAIELEPDNVWWRSRWISYLITRGRMAASHSAWLDTLDQVELPDAGADPTIYRNLHVWVARLLLHRGQLDMAAEVLEGIPEENLRDDLGLRALKRRLDALLQARRGEAVFPLSVSQDHQWDGPHLAPKRLNKHPLTRWMPARVDAVSEEGISLQVAEPPREPSNSARIGFLEVSRDQFNRGSEDIDAEQLEAGRFLELVWYEQQEQPLIRVFPAHEAQDPDLPPLFPDPARYLRRAGWVE